MAKATRFGWLACLVSLAANAAAGGAEVRRAKVDVRLPDVELTDQADRRLPAAEILTDAKIPVLVQFIFTSCPTICPALAANFAAAGEELGAAARFVSISIDPEHDTPARLAGFGQQFGAVESWSLVTGERRDIGAIQKAFGVYQGNKMWHAPLTFLKAPGTGTGWVRLDGMLTPAQLEEEAERVSPRRSVAAELAGRRLYEDGVTVSGEPLRAALPDGIAVQGKQFACASCHRPSGFGSSEGLVASPPVTAKSLFRPLESNRNRGDDFRELFQEFGGDRARLHDLKPRPAYTRESLERALRSGVDPAGRSLDPIMPRYQLEDSDVGALLAYLQTLGATPGAGVAPKVCR